MSKPPNYVKFYNQYLYIDIPQNNIGEYQTDCPFKNCRKENHLYVNTDTGLWHCKRCDERGNNQTLVTKLHEEALAETTLKQLKFVSNLRKLDVKILELAKFAYDEIFDRWYVPYFTFDIGKRQYSPFLNNLGIFYPSLSNPREQFVIRKGSSFAAQLYNPGIHSEDVDIENAYIQEGEWDNLAYYEHYSDRYALGKPGSGFTKAAIKALLKSENIYTMLDNDMGGQKQTNQVIEILKTETKAKIFALNWTGIEDAPKDVRELHIQNRINEIEENFIIMEEARQDIHVKMDREGNEEEDPASYIRSIADVEPVHTYTAYTEGLRRCNLELSIKTYNAVLALMAIPLTTHIGGIPVWTFLRGPGSCIAGDVIVKINRAGKTFDITMKDLYHRFHGGVAGGKTWTDRPDITTKIQQRAEDGSIQLVPLRDVMYSGRKKLYILKTETGKEIRTSADHKYLTTKGWKRLSKLRIGDYVYSNQGRKSGTTRKTVKINNFVGCRYHPYAQQRNVRRVSDGYTIPLHRATVEANMNDMDIQSYLFIIRNIKETASELIYLNPETEHVHHIDEDRTNNQLSNLKVMDASEHKRMHSTEKYFTNVLEQALPDRITAIIEDEVEDVYDLSVDHPHNFLANGIVVHNSGKTTYVDSFGGENELFDCLSKVSAESLVSGFRDDEGLTTSYLPLLINKTLIIKDFTVTLLSPPDQLNKVMGILTDIYDGRVKIHYGNAKMNDFKNTHFNMIACVTPLIDGFSASNIGDRFLRIDWLGDDTNRAVFTKNAIASLNKEKEIDKNTLSRLTLGYLKHQMAREIDTRMDDTTINTLQQLADFTATLSTKVVTDRHDGLKFKPEPQLGARIGKQLGKIYLGVRHMVGEDKGMEVARKVAFDSSKGFPLDIVKHIMDNNFTTRNEIAAHIGISSAQSHRLVNELITMNILQEKRSTTGSSGRPTMIYTINETLIPALKHGSYSKIRSNLKSAPDVPRLVPPRRAKPTR